MGRPSIKEPKKIGSQGGRASGLSGKQASLRAVGYEPEASLLTFLWRRSTTTGQARGLSSVALILARCLGPPYRCCAWVNNSADAPNANVAELISNAKEPSKNRCVASRRAPKQKNPRHRRSQRNNVSCSVPARYLIVDGHSAIFGWPEMHRLHSRRSSLARDALVKKLRDYQDYTGVRVVVVFDGKGSSATEQTEPHSVQVFYSRAGQTADTIIERLANKYAKKFDLTVATSDFLEQETASACGAACISIENLRALINEAVPN